MLEEDRLRAVEDRAGRAPNQGYFAKVGVFQTKPESLLDTDVITGPEKDRIVLDIISFFEIKLSSIL